MTTRRELLASAALWLLAGAPAIAADNWIEGTHYTRVATPQAPAAAGTVAITEVFSYGCPACNAFLPYAQALEKKLPGWATMEYLPASWIATEDWPVLQRGYLAAKALGVDRKAHAALFAALWSTGEMPLMDKATGRPAKPLPSIDDLGRFYERHAGVKAADFVAAANSFSVVSAMAQADARIKEYRAESTPTIVVNGKWLLTPQTAGGMQQAIDLAVWLAQREPHR